MFKIEHLCRRSNEAEGMVSICLSGALRTTPSKAPNIILNLVPPDILNKQSAHIQQITITMIGDIA